MGRDNERIEWVREAMRRAYLQALVCRLPHNVLLPPGYWPVLGDSVVVFSLEGEAALVVPGDEDRLAQAGWVNDIRTFKPVTLEKLSNSVAETTPLLADIANHLGRSVPQSRFGGLQAEGRWLERSPPSTGRWLSVGLSCRYNRRRRPVEVELNLRSTPFTCRMPRGLGRPSTPGVAQRAGS